MTLTPSDRISREISVVCDQKDTPSRLECFAVGPDASSFEVQTRKSEEPGPFFHPLIATLITGGARLMLAMAESLALKAELDWAFCDTDSMAFAKPDVTPSEEFFERAQGVARSFDALNPYAKPGSLLKAGRAPTLRALMALLPPEPMGPPEDCACWPRPVLEKRLRCQGYQPGHEYRESLKYGQGLGLHGHEMPKEGAPLQSFVRKRLQHALAKWCGQIDGGYRVFNSSIGCHCTSTFERSATAARFGLTTAAVTTMAGRGRIKCYAWPVAYRAFRLRRRGAHEIHPRSGGLMVRQTIRGRRFDDSPRQER